MRLMINGNCFCFRIRGETYSKEVMSIRLLWLLGSFFGFSLGIIGLILPILPHLPFLIAGAFCLSKVSSRFQNLMLDLLHSKYGEKFLQPVTNKLMEIRWIKRIVKA